MWFRQVQPASLVIMFSHQNKGVLQHNLIPKLELAKLTIALRGFSSLFPACVPWRRSLVLSQRVAFARRRFCVYKGKRGADPVDG